MTSPITGFSSLSTAVYRWLRFFCLCHDRNEFTNGSFLPHGPAKKLFSQRWPAMDSDHRQYAFAVAQAKADFTSDSQPSCRPIPWMNP